MCESILVGRSNYDGLGVSYLNAKVLSDPRPHTLRLWHQLGKGLNLMPVDYTYHASIDAFVDPALGTDGIQLAERLRNEQTASARGSMSMLPA